MPTFDFRCAACNTLFEKTLPFGSKSKPACPSCGSKKTEKQLSMPSIAFKGSGFYKTDSTKPATPSKKSSDSSESSASSESSSPTPETPTEKKPEPKPEPADSVKPDKKP